MNTLSLPLFAKRACLPFAFQAGKIVILYHTKENFFKKWWYKTNN